MLNSLETHTKFCYCYFSERAFWFVSAKSIGKMKRLNSIIYDAISSRWTQMNSGAEKIIQTKKGLQKFSYSCSGLESFGKHGQILEKIKRNSFSWELPAFGKKHVVGLFICLRMSVEYKLNWIVQFSQSFHILLPTQKRNKSWNICLNIVINCLLFGDQTKWNYSNRGRQSDDKLCFYFVSNIFVSWGKT